MPEKIVRDVVHDVIAFRIELPVERLLFDLMNAAEFQRLRRIRQLGLTSLAYPGADHSRYSHSLGVMETARKMLSQLELDFHIDAYQRTVCLAGALLHDLGHGPFSHVFERVSGIEHEEVTCRMILDPAGEVHRLLAGHHASLPRDIVEMLSHRPDSFLSDVISSQLDADRFDYLLRDNLMTGSRYGDYDLNWLLHALTVDVGGDRLAVHTKGISAVEAFLQSRYHMYRNVYFHKVVRTAEGMVRLALQRAKRLAVQGRLSWPSPEDTVHSALVGRQLTLEQFTELDDVSVMHCFKAWAGESDTVLARLCRGLLYRRLYKVIDLPVDISRADVDALLGKVREAVAASGGDPDYDIFYDEPADTPYDLAAGGEGGGEHGRRQIAVVDEQGRVVPFATLSALPEALDRQLFFRRLHVTDAYEVVAGQVLRSGEG
jgi:HD superfamily phosphohydrolase